MTNYEAIGKHTGFLFQYTVYSRYEKFQWQWTCMLYFMEPTRLYSDFICKLLQAVLGFLMSISLMTVQSYDSLGKKCFMTCTCTYYCCTILMVTWSQFGHLKTSSHLWLVVVCYNHIIIICVLFYPMEKLDSINNHMVHLMTMVICSITAVKMVIKSGQVTWLVDLWPQQFTMEIKISVVVII